MKRREPISKEEREKILRGLEYLENESKIANSKIEYSYEMDRVKRRIKELEEKIKELEKRIS